MIPGPVEVDEDVLAAMGGPVAVHYGPEWVRVYRDTVAKLGAVFRTAGDIFLIPGSGSAGLDAAIGSLIGPGERCLVAVNGFFGERLAAIARSHGAEVTEVRAEWGQPISPEAVRAALRRRQGIQALFVVHHETSTGVLNPVRELGEVAQEFTVPFVVDAISSLGGEELAMDEWGIDICVTASQKCLEAPPGLAPLAVRPLAWQVMDRKKDHHCGWYLDLRTWREYAQAWADWHPYPVTLPTNLVLALRVALDKILEETLARRWQRYNSVSQALRQGLRERGFPLLADDAWASSAVTAAMTPPNLSPERVIAFLQDRHGIRITGGMGQLKGKIFRVGHMGKAASLSYVERFLVALDDLLSTMGS